MNLRANALMIFYVICPCLRVQSLISCRESSKQQTCLCLLSHCSLSEFKTEAESLTADNTFLYFPFPHHNSEKCERKKIAPRHKKQYEDLFHGAFYVLKAAYLMSL